jgi:hypothetical protein
MHRFLTFGFIDEMYRITLLYRESLADLVAKCPDVQKILE